MSNLSPGLNIASKINVEYVLGELRNNNDVYFRL